MGQLLSSLVPAKNLNYGILAAGLTVLALVLVRKFLGLDLAQQISTMVSTPDSQVTPQAVTAELAGFVGYAIAHVVDVYANLKKTPPTQG